MVRPAQQFYEFGSFRVDPIKRHLLRGGEVVPLTPKAFDTLLVLIEGEGELVEKDRLIKRVWPDSFVEEGNLTYNIYALRKALGERPGENQYIVTVPGRGYRFVPNVMKVPGEHADLILDEHTRISVIVEKTDGGEVEQHPGNKGKTQVTSSVKQRPNLSGLFRRPRVFIPATVAALALLGALLWLRATPHQPSPQALYWYKQGISAINEGQYYKADKTLRQAINADEKFPLSHARLAEALTELDYTDEAKNEIIRAESLVSDRSKLSSLDALYLKAISNVVIREFDLAIANYQEIARQSPTEEKAHVYVELGRTYEKNDELDKAKEVYREAIRFAPQDPAAFLRLGAVCGQQQDIANAMEAFGKAEALYDAVTNVEGVAEARYERGYLLNNLNKLPEAREQLQKVLDTARIIDNKHQQIKTLLELSRNYCTGGETARAQQQANEAVSLAQANDMENLSTQGILQLGNAFRVRGDYGEAEKYFRQALEFAQRDKGRRNEARALVMLGGLRITLHDADQGLEYIRQALPFYEKGGYRRDAAMALYQFGRAYELKGDSSAARRAFKKQLQVARKVSDRSYRALAHRGIALAFVYQERYPEALRHFNKGYSIYSSLGNQLYAGNRLIDCGEMLWRLGRYDDAQAAFDQAVSIAEQADIRNKQMLDSLSLVGAYRELSERRFAKAITKGNQALTLNAENEHSIEARYVIGLAQALSGARLKGRRMCEEAVEAARRATYPPILSGALMALAEAMLESGDAQGALANASEAQTRFESAGQQESEWRARLIQARASLLAGDAIKAGKYASLAEGLLSNLRQRWGVEAYETYLKRPDIRYYREHLIQLLHANQ